jgi:hypothetical protein
MRAVAGSLTGVVGSTDGNGSAALFNYPHGISCFLDGGFILHVTEYEGKRVRQIINDTRSVSTFGSSAGQISHRANASGLNLLGITTDATTPGFLYVSGSNFVNLDPIFKITIGTGTITGTIGLARGYNGDGSVAASYAKFSNVRGLANDSRNPNVLYIADTNNNAVRKFFNG